MHAEDRALFDRSLRAATASHTGEALDGALDDLGWADALTEDPAAAVSLLFEHQGLANATSASLDRVLGDTIGLIAPPAAAIVLPALGSSDPPGVETDAGTTVRGLGTAALAGSSSLLVATRRGALSVDRSTLELRPVGGIDPTLGLVEVTGDGLPPADPWPVDWDLGLTAGRRALAHELVGASKAMLGLARDHAVERIQFGVPIASFQAVRHRLAESLVAIEAAAAAADAAWLDGSPLGAALAKAIAGRSARTVARHAQQVLAGIGFTTEHDLHLHLRRTYALDALLGDTRTLTLDLGQQLLTTRSVPALSPL